MPWFWRNRAPDASRQLQNPGLDEQHLTQIGHAFLGRGFAYFVHGPGSLSECYRACASNMRVLDQGFASPVGLGGISQDGEGNGDVVWTGYENQAGSVILFFQMASAEVQFFLHSIAKPVGWVRDPWVSGKTGYQEVPPPEVLKIVNGTHATPVWEIAGLEHLRPGGAPGPLPIALYELAVAQFGPDAPGLRSRPGQLVELLNPQLNEHDLTQIVYNVLKLQGTTMMVFGPGTVAECYQACLRAAPVIGDVASGSGRVASLRAPSGVNWIGVEGPEGAAIVFVVLNESDLNEVHERLLRPMGRVGTPWSCDYAAEGARVPEAALPILRAARGIALSAMPGHEEQRDH